MSDAWTISCLFLKRFRTLLKSIVLENSSFLKNVQNNKIMSNTKKLRQFNRYSIASTAKIRRNKAQDWASVKIASLSSMGASFEYTGALNPHDVIEFFMAPPDPKISPYHFSARVVWIADKQVGIEFIGDLRSP